MRRILPWPAAPVLCLAALLAGVADAAPEPLATLCGMVWLGLWLWGLVLLLPEGTELVRFESGAAGRGVERGERGRGAMVTLDDELAAERERQVCETFYTPPAVTRAILPHLGHRGEPRGVGYVTVLEPAAGRGHILEVLAQVGYTREWMTAVEIRRGEKPYLRNAAGVVWIENFLDLAVTWAREGRRWGLVITNPPFELALRFAQAALPLLAPGGTLALLAPLTFTGSQGRAGWVRAHTPHQYTLPARPTFTNGETGKQDLAWFVWPEGKPEGAPGRLQVLDDLRAVGQSTLPGLGE